MSYFLRFCSNNDPKSIDILKKYNTTEVLNVVDNNPVNKINTWDIDDNITGLEEKEYQQIIENNNSHELYENLLTDEDSNRMTGNLMF